MRHLALAASTSLTASLLVASCSSPAPPTVPGPVAEPAIAAELVQYRRDEALHQMQVKVTNTGTREVVVDRVAVWLPGFDDVPPSEPGTVLGPGRRVDLPVVYGAARCEGGRPGSTTDSPVVRLHLDGAAKAVEVEPADEGLLARLAAAECAQRAVTEAVPLGFADAWVPVGSGDALTVAGVLRVGPVRAGTAARLEVLDGTTLFGITTSVSLPLALAGPAVDVPVTVAPQRCDPHAVAESKRGYAFRVGVSLGAEPVLVTVEVDPAQQPVLQAALLERCGLG